MAVLRPSRSRSGPFGPHLGRGGAVARCSVASFPGGGMVAATNYPKHQVQLVNHQQHLMMDVLTNDEVKSHLQVTIISSSRILHSLFVRSSNYAC